MSKEKIFDTILENYDEAGIFDMIDNAMLDYVDDDWEEDGFDSEYDWYCEFGRNEAESDVLESIITECCKKLNIDLSLDNFIEVEERIAEHWGVTI